MGKENRPPFPKLGGNMVKRILTGLIGAAVVIALLWLNNMVVTNIALTFVALVSLSEFYNAFKNKGHKPLEVVGYILTLGILGIGFIEAEATKVFLFLVLPILLFILFTWSIFSNMKYTVMDIAITVLGIIYVPFLYSFISFIWELENGVYYVFYLLMAGWATDTFAYFVGVKFGKHKFSKISPKKSIEGCIGGTVGCTIIFIAYTYFLNNNLGFELNYVLMGITGVIFSIISQIGDFSASSIKRYCEIKDFGSIMPGHGGFLDRFDSIILVAPFVFILFQFVI